MPFIPFEVFILVGGVVLALVLLTVMFVVALMRQKDGDMPALAYFIVPVLTLMVIFTLVAWAGSQGLPAEIQLPLLLSAGVVLLLMALAAVTVVFRQQQLTDPKEALGLPSGSVRAVIALTLILIFAIMSIYLYSRNVNLTTRTVPNITQEQLDRIPAQQIFSVAPVTTPSPPPNASPPPAGAPTPAPRFNAQIIAPVSPVGEDIAKQIITTVSTLVVAISAFYFGTSAVTAAQAAVAGGLALQVLITPTSARGRRKDGGEGWEPVELSVLTTPRGLDVTATVEGDATSSVTKVENEHYRYQPTSDAKPVVRIRFALASRPDISAESVVDMQARQGTAPVVTS